ncbi:RHS repeat-associated core domain-containing protein [Rhodanobacter sp. MP1X3]|uniref:RHS repeat-associated core domain-containing protein n=1 Tax=Rhodanobacter sp. MP1X3 TaxID=2723086 RepID=UPI00210667D3|nr:RHS repeat-associated core domain-containing protein [Rhodanobacter sp. MP1X3]
MCEPKKRSLPLKLLPALLILSLSPASLLAQSVTTVMTYDAGDHVASVTDPRGLVTTYAHDGLGLLWRQTSPDTGTTNFVYDGYGRQSSMTRADGVQTTYGYDGLNRRTSVSAGGLTQTFAYDNCTNGLGRLCSDSDAIGATSYSYTPEGWIGGRGFTIGSTTYALGFNYDEVGRLTVVNYPDSNQVVYYYTNGVVSGVSLKIGSASPINGATAITYRPTDMAMASWTSSNGLINTLNYDTDGRLAGISVPGKQSLGFTYDAADRITQITNGIDNTLTQNFGYDYMSQLTSVYSGADNESYQYDANGNRTYQNVNGTALNETPSSTSNQLASVAGTLNATYGYDAKGNSTVVNGGAAYNYDAFNRLNTSSGMTYYVDPEGQRLRKTGSAGTTYFAPGSDGGMLAESQGSGWTDYVWLNGRMIGRIANGQAYAIHDDQVGRPEAVTDASQNVVWRAQNFAFTQKVIVSNITLNLGFPGQYYDAETLTWNNGYRDFNSGLGRYLESDPSGLPGGINTYAYVGNNPVRFVDPKGLDIYVANTAQVGGLHEKIVVGPPGGPLYGQSFGMTSRDSPQQSTSSAADPAPGGKGSGEVYEDEDPITNIDNRFYLKTTPLEDLAAIAYLRKQLGNAGPYNVMTNSCRNYSQAQYFKLLNLVLGMRY